MSNSEKTAAPGPSAKAPAKIDALGITAFAVYIAIGMVFVFGFGRSIIGAVQTQNETPCRSLVPMQARVAGIVLDAAGAPVADAQIIPVLDGRTLPGVPVAPDGSFSMFVPRNAQTLRATAPGKGATEGTLVVQDSEVVEVEFRLGKADGEAGTFIEVARSVFEAPELELEDLAGNPVSLSQFRGKFVVLNFWATWCEPCISEWPQLSKLADRVGDSDEVVILAVSIDEKVEDIEPFLTRMSLLDTRVKVLWDATTVAHRQYGSDKIPDTYFVDEQGLVRHVFVNEREWGSPDAYHCVESSAGR